MEEIEARLNRMEEQSRQSLRFIKAGVSTMIVIGLGLLGFMFSTHKTATNNKASITILETRVSDYEKRQSTSTSLILAKIDLISFTWKGDDEGIYMANREIARYSKMLMIDKE